MLHKNRLTANIPSEILSLDGLRELYAHHCSIQRTWASLATGRSGHFLRCAGYAEGDERARSGILPGSISCCICRAGRKPCGIPSLVGCPILRPPPFFFFGRSIYGNSFSSDVSRILEKITKMPSIEHLHLFDPDLFKEFAKHHKEL